MIASVYVRHALDGPNRCERQFSAAAVPGGFYYVYRGDKHRVSARTRSWEKAEQNARKKEGEYEAHELAAEQGRQLRGKRLHA